MYLSTPNCFELDNIIKSFEVSYRSFVVEKLKSKFASENDFLDAINELLLKVKPSSVINSNRNYKKLSDIKGKYIKHYQAISDCFSNYVSRNIEDNDVPFVSTVIDYVELFFDPTFVSSDLIKGFSPIEFVGASEKYRKIRNDLSHPASSKISLSDTKEIFLFIKRLSLNLDDKYFWFVPKDIINRKIDALAQSISENPIKIHNLDEIAFAHQRKVICRENEINILKQYLFGSTYRNAGSIVIFGYGGLGKTALVLELIDEIIKDCIDKSNVNKLEFILFFTSKEEVLDYSQTTGNLQIKQLRKQISSFEEFRSKFFSTLKINDISDLEKSRGIVVIDNIETLSESGEKDKIMNFISNSPPTVQYILTSREEEECDKRMSLKGFEQSNRGEEFLGDYIKFNNLDVDLQNKELELLKASKGNTLILILSLLRLNDKLSNITEIVSELNSISSPNIETVSLFMYRNTFDRIVRELDSPDTMRILTVISLYNEAVDLYSISKLSVVNNLTEVERICDRLASKLVLSKIEDYYELNEFANKFIFIKLRQNTIEEKELRGKIDDYRYSRRQKMRRLEEKKLSNTGLKAIMEDWYPRNNTDRLAIYDVYNLYRKATELVGEHNNMAANQMKIEINDGFEEAEAMSAHPYIKFQKAKIYELFLKKQVRGYQLQELIADITTCYEDIIITIKVDFKYIKNTKSYASVLWFYGQFLIYQFNHYSDALKYLDESKRVFEELGHCEKSEQYKGVLKSLKITYKELDSKTRNSDYAYELKVITNLIQRL
jgi:hypothetical protein